MQWLLNYFKHYLATKTSNNNNNRLSSNEKKTINLTHNINKRNKLESKTYPKKASGR